MHKVLLVMALFGALSSRAQITLIIEDQTNSGFKLIINQHLQNGLNSKKLIVENIPLSDHQLTFLLQDSAKTKLRRPLTLSASGKYKYVLTRNFKGELKFRYRGKQNSLPSGYTREEYNTIIAYVPAIRTAQAEEKPKQKPEPPAASAAKVDTIKPEIAAVETASPDTLPAEVAAKKPAEKPLEKPVTFESLFEELLAKAYEFEKLHFAEERLLSRAVTDTQVARVLEVFKYDQTRMQFLEGALQKNPSLKKSGKLFMPKFEYEISRKKVSELVE